MPITAIKWKGQTLVKRVTWIFAFVTVDILWGHIENFAPRHAEMRLATDFTLAPYGDPWFPQTLQIWWPFSTFEFSNIWWQFIYFRVTGFSEIANTLVLMRLYPQYVWSNFVTIAWEMGTFKARNHFPDCPQWKHWYTRMSKMVRLYKFCGHASVTIRFVWSMGILA